MLHCLIYGSLTIFAVKEGCILVFSRNLRKKREITDFC